MKRRLKLGTAVVGMAITATVAAAASTPAVVTQNATSVTNTSANLRGTVNPEGSSTSYYFLWGPTTNYGAQTSSRSVGSGTKTVSVTRGLSNLVPGTRYHYRLVATNRFGTSLGSDHSFMTTGHPPAVAITGPPFAVGHTFAVITGDVNPEGASTHWSFQWGPTTAYGSQTFGGDLPASQSLQEVHETLAGLAAGATFHYRVVAQHGSVVTYGGDQSFTTYPSPRPLPAVHARTTPHRLRNKPYIFTTTGSIGVPRSIPSGPGCSGGQIAVRYFVGHKSYALAVGALQPNCTFTVGILFHHLVHHRSTRLRIEIRFRGNPYLGSASARVERVRLG